MSSNESVSPSFEKERRDSKSVMFILMLSPTARSLRVGAAGQLITYWTWSSLPRSELEPKTALGRGNLR